MPEIKAAKDSNFIPKADKIDKTDMLKSFLLSFYLDSSKSLPGEIENINFLGFIWHFRKCIFYISVGFYNKKTLILWGQPSSVHKAIVF